MNQRNIFKLLSLAGVVLGGIGTLLSGWADNKEQEAIIEEGQRSTCCQKRRGRVLNRALLFFEVNS